MMYLKLADRPPVAIDKAVFTVGWGSAFDVSLGNAAEALCFSIQKDGDEYFLLPGSERLRLNARVVSGAERLTSCDRITWREEAGVVVSQIEMGTAASKKDSSLECLHILEKLSTDLENAESLSRALRQALSSMAGIAGAQGGNLVSEVEPGAGWDLLASFGVAANPGSEESSRKVILSHTAVNEAIRTRKPVYVESIVGHDWATNASIMGARVFSLACLPLVVGDRVFGCVYLFTRTPGKSIDPASLSSLSILGTQVALLLATRAQLNRERLVNQKRQTGQQGKVFVYDRTDAANPMKVLDSRITKLAAADLNLLILGETGSGKELVARELHQRGPRAQGPFIAVNCGAIPPSLIESTLFGYVKGSFTGAMKDQDGKFVQADGGTLFLDEIGDLPLDLQVKLLRVLQERTVEPVGGSKPIPVNFHLVAATHQDLESQVKTGKFRQDLFYRLNGASLQVPALRNRGSDIPMLAEYFLKNVSATLRLSNDAKKQLVTHAWPGNVRELEQVISRAAALTDGEEITAEDLEMGVLAAVSKPASPLDFADMPSSLKDAQERFTSEFVKTALEESGGVRSRAAARLGISERTLYRILSSDSGDNEV